MAAKKPINPFYPLLVVAGTAFCITACAYGLMAMRSLRPHQAGPAAKAGAAQVEPRGPHPLMTFLERHGTSLLLSELGLLAVFSFAAMGTDGYWTRRAEAAAARSKPSLPENNG
jgi:hypothetical protein